MALYGPDIPLARNIVDQRKRKEIFDIIAPYSMSLDDMEIFRIDAPKGAGPLARVLYSLPEGNALYRASKVVQN